MPTTVWAALGTTLSVDEISGNTNTFTLINGFTSLEGLGGGTIVQARTTVLTNTVHTYRGTLKDPTEISGDLFCDPTDAVHKFIQLWAENPTNGPYTMQATFATTGGNTATFLANISEFNGPTASDVEANLTAAMAFKLTGHTTWA